MWDKNSEECFFCFFCHCSRCTGREGSCLLYFLASQNENFFMLAMYETAFALLFSVLLSVLFCFEMAHFL